MEICECSNISLSLSLSLLMLMCLSALSPLSLSLCISELIPVRVNRVSFYFQIFFSFFFGGGGGEGMSASEWRQRDYFSGCMSDQTT